MVADIEVWYITSMPTTSTNYIVACWMGPRRAEDPRNVQDRASYLKAHVAALSRLKHNLDHITVVLAEGGDEEGDLYAMGLEKISKTPVTVLTRSNEDMSYASWNHAFETLGTKFTHHVVVEDDYVPYQNDFDSILVEAADRHKTYVCGLVDHHGTHAAISNGIIPTKIWKKVHPLPTKGGRRGDVQSVWSRAFHQKGFPIEEYLDRCSSPFWVTRSVRWYGHPSLPPLFVPVHALDRPVAITGGPVAVTMVFGSDGQMRLQSEEDGKLWEQLCETDLRDQMWRGRFTRVFDAAE